MPDASISLVISRDQLGLDDLELNDHVMSYISSQNFLGAAVQYQRNQIQSPFIDGQITTFRSLQSVQDNLTLEVLGGSHKTMINNLNTIVAAFLQDTYNLRIKFGVTSIQYACEAADYTVDYTSERWIQPQALVTFSFPRQPTPVSGGF